MAGWSLTRAFTRQPLRWYGDAMTHAAEARAERDRIERRSERGRWLLWPLGLLGVAGPIGLAIGLGTLGPGCSAQAGMFCLQQSDCRPGLVCNKAPGASRPDQYGICEPARRSSGEACLRSSDCVPGLVCSSELGGESPDERHGVCTPTSGGIADGGIGERSDAASRD